MATYSKSMLLRLTEEQHTKLESDARTAGLSAQSYARQKLFPEDPTAISSTPVSNTYAALTGDVQNLRSSVETFYNSIEAGALTQQPIDRVVKDATNKARSILGGEE